MDIHHSSIISLAARNNHNKPHTCMAAGLVKGEGFAVDASVMEANAGRYHGKAPDSSRQRRS
jgi:hypothetical protein